MIIKSKQYFLPAILLLLLTIGIFLFTKQRQPVYPQALCKDCNVILITMTNLRFDHMSSNGYFRPTTPSLDKFAQESIVFDNAFSQASWTLPASFSLYTSLYPFQHGIMNRYDGSTLSPSTPTLMDVLNKNGYKTSAFTGGFDYNPVFGHTSRFASYQECAGGKLPEYPRQVGMAPSRYGGFDCAIPLALDWLSKNASQKFFLHVQGFDLHCPFYNSKGGRIYDKDYKGTIDFSVCLNTFEKTEPEIKNGKKYYPVFSEKGGIQPFLLSEEDHNHLIALYDESIAFADQEIVKLLSKIKELGLDNKTIIVFTSEHGEMYGKHGRFMRGGPLRGTFYDDVLHIPLIIKHPKISARHIDGLAQLIDVTPSLLAFLGLQIPTRMEGESLTSLIFQNKDVNEYIFAGAAYNPDPLNPRFNKRTRSEIIRDKRWKLIREVIFDGNNSLENLELYDIVNDKEELVNLASERKDILNQMQVKLSNWSKNLQ